VRFLQPGLAVEDASDGPIAVLSARERDVFRLLVRALRSSDIASQLCISVKTVETHRERVMRKLGVHSAVQLMRFAVMNRLLDAGY
jgi:DNA-binding NarL/FixJ family response regulator